MESQENISFKESGTVYRKNKQLNGFHIYHRPFNSDTPVGHIPGRFISSGVVVRVPIPDNEVNHDDRKMAKLPDSDFQESGLSKYCHGSHPLRTPMKRNKSKYKPTGDEGNSSGMTRNCEELFSKLKSNCIGKNKSVNLEPSFSVRRILKGSGLLEQCEKYELPEAQGEENNETSSNDSKNIYIFSQNSPDENEQELTSPTPNTELFQGNIWPKFKLEDIPFSTQKADPLSKFKLRDDLVDYASQSDERPEEEQENSCKTSYLTASPSQCVTSSPILLRSSTPSPLFYDTVMLQKTVETEIVQYLPTQSEAESVKLMKRASPKSNISNGSNRKSNGHRRPLRKRRKRVSRKCALSNEGSGYDPSSDEENSQ